MLLRNALAGQYILQRMQVHCGLCAIELLQPTLIFSCQLIRIYPVLYNIISFYLSEYTIFGAAFYYTYYTVIVSVCLHTSVYKLVQVANFTA